MLVKFTQIDFFSYFKELFKTASFLVKAVEMTLQLKGCKQEPGSRHKSTENANAITDTHDTFNDFEVNISIKDSTRTVR